MRSPRSAKCDKLRSFFVGTYHKQAGAITVCFKNRLPDYKGHISPVRGDFNIMQITKSQQVLGGEWAGMAFSCVRYSHRGRIKSSSVDMGERTVHGKRD